MKVYKADKELEDILFSQGFIDTTPKTDKLKRKKRFRISKYSKKEISFDWGDIRIIDEKLILDSKFEITEIELKLLILYFKLKKSDWKKVRMDGSFAFEDVNQRFNSVKSTLEIVTEIGSMKSLRNRLEFIIDMYENIDLSN